MAICAGYVFVLNCQTRPPLKFCKVSILLYARRSSPILLPFTDVYAGSLTALFVMYELTILEVNSPRRQGSIFVHFNLSIFSRVSELLSPYRFFFVYKPLLMLLLRWMSKLSQSVVGTGNDPLRHLSILRALNPVIWS